MEKKGEKDIERGMKQETFLGGRKKSQTPVRRKPTV